MAMASSNPALSRGFDHGFEQDFAASPSTVMTVNGTIGKTFALLAILSATAIYSWNQTAAGQLQPAVLPASMIGGFILAMITIFKPKLSPWTAPVYAAFEGVFLGTFSFFVEHLIQNRVGGTGYPGIAIEAVLLTGATLFCMLFLYSTGLVRVTQKLRAGIMAATGAVCLVYMVSIVVSMFGGTVPFLNDATPIGIGISLFVVGLAAFNLLLDFDFIEQGAQQGAPKYMEWYGAFGLMVTLVWLYLEILRLLRKFQDRG